MSRWLSRRLMLPLVVSLSLLIALLVAACQQPAAPPATGAGAQPTARSSGNPQLTKVNLRLNWSIKGEFAPLFVAREKGYYKDEGIDIQLLEGKSATQAVQVVGSGSDDFGYVPSIQLITGVNEKIPVKTVSTILKSTPMVWISMPDLPMPNPRVAEGKKVVISPASTFNLIWNAFAESLKLDKSKIEVVGADPAARFSLFLDRKVDILGDTFSTNELPMLQAKVDKPLNLLKVADYGFDVLGYVMITNEKTLKERPELVRQLNRATLKGFLYTAEHPDEAADIMSGLYPSVLDKQVTRGQVKEMAKLMAGETADSLGRGTDKAWQNTLDTLAKAGVITEKKAPSAYYTNDLVK